MSGPPDTVYKLGRYFTIDWSVTNHEDTAVVVSTSAGGTGAFEEWTTNGTGSSSDPNPVSLGPGGLALRSGPPIGELMFFHASNTSSSKTMT